MVIVARGTPEQLRQWAAKLLPSLITHWEGLSQSLAEIDSWDPVEQATYVEEWRLRENQRIILQRYASSGILTMQQRQQVVRLRQLAAEHESAMAQLLGVSRLTDLDL